MKLPEHVCSDRIRREVAVLAMVALACTIGWARDGVRVPGQVSLDDREVSRPLQVELRNLRMAALVQHTQVSQGGELEFDSVEPGEYNLVVTDSRGRRVCEEPVSITGNSDFLSIRLPGTGTAVADAAEATVSARQLQRRIPGLAWKQLRASNKAFQKGDLSQAISHAEKALQLYPDYPEAHNDFGVYYARMNQFGKAAAEFQRARELDPDLWPVCANLSMALLRLGRYSEAEEAARHALKLNPGSDKARFALGVSLGAQQRHDKEALWNLHRAAALIPEARLAAAGILARTGRRTEAAVELRQYLGSPDIVACRENVVALLSRLQR